MKIKAKITGSKKDGYVLTVTNSTDDFTWDVALVADELIAIRDEINKKIK